MKNPAAVALGRLGGLVASEKQREAARKNGKLGGRPVGAYYKNRLELAGRVFGRLTVLSEAPRRRNRRFWLCKCTCGNSHIASTGCLLTGHVRSCGCLQREVATTHGAKAGGKATPEYAAWASMNERCSNIKHKAYVNYGGRGITVCEAWRNSFEEFYAHMGDRPTPRHSLDRKDNNAGYFPENCRWSTRNRQENNKRSNRLMTVDGLTLNVSQHCRRVGVNRIPVYARLNMGWSDTDALYTPFRIMKKQNKENNK